jgi:hypothetical protein
VLDLFTMRFGDVDDRTMGFSRAQRSLSIGVDGPQREAAKSREVA